MNKLFRKLKPLMVMAVLCAAVLPALAAGAPSVSVPETEILVDQITGQYSFTIEIDAQENYAGAEFGVICSQGVQITAVTSTAGSVTGPQEANGLVWFGFYDGQDSFQGATAVTVEGTCPTGTDCAVAIQDVSLYTIGLQEYASTPVECGQVVNLRQTLEAAVPPTEPQAEEAGKTHMNVPVLLACCAVIAAGAAGALIYQYKHPQTTTKKEKEHASEQTEKR